MEDISLIDFVLYCILFSSNGSEDPVTKLLLIDVVLWSLSVGDLDICGQFGLVRHFFLWLVFWLGIKKIRI